MASYIENAFDGEKYILPCQFSDTTAEEFFHDLGANGMVALKVPSSQSLGCTWYLLIILESSVIYCLNAKCTGVGGWDEIGSLSVSKVLAGELDELNKVDWMDYELSDFRSNECSYLKYDSVKISAEVGIELKDSSSGMSIQVLAAPPPGAVSVKCDFYESDFQPELDLSDLIEVTV